MKSNYSEIDEVIAYVHENIEESLSLFQLAQIAAYSPYHFSRIFKKQTGLSPNHYVTSFKIQKAKELLLTTDLRIRDVGMEIGQQSLGTFTTRFRESVGVTPAQFRQSPEQVTDYLQTLKSRGKLLSQALLQTSNQTVAGTVKASFPFHGLVFIGLFALPIPAGLPLYGTILSSIGSFYFTNVRPGSYYLMATAISWEMDHREILIPSQTLRAKIDTPIIVQMTTPPLKQHLTLRKAKLDDPPILISLPLLMKNYLNRET